MDKFDHRRTISVSTTNIARAGKDQDYLLVLSSCLIIKANFINSVISDFSYRKFAKLIGKRYDDAKRIVELGVKFELFKFYTKKMKNGKWKTYLRANRLYHPEEINAYKKKGENACFCGHHVVRFGVITPSKKNGEEKAQLFMLSSKSSISKKFDNYEKYKNSTNKLTLSNTCDLVLFAAIIPILKGNELRRIRDLYNRLSERGLDNKYKGLKTKKQKQSFKDVILDEFEKGERNIQNTGISYKYIASRFPNLKNVNEYRIGKIINRYGIEDHILESSPNYVYMTDCKPKRHDNDEFNLPQPKNKVEAWKLSIKRDKLIKKACLQDYVVGMLNYWENDMEVVDLTKRGFHAPKKRKNFIKCDDDKIRWKQEENPNRYKVYIRLANSYDVQDASYCIVFSHKEHQRWQMKKQQEHVKLRKEVESKQRAIKLAM